MDNKKLEELLKIIQYYGLCPTMAKLFGEKFRLRIPYSEAICDLPVTELGLNVRPFNALKRGGVNTIGDLVDTIANGKLFQIRCLGQKCAKEIKFTLAEYGYNSLSPERKKSFILDMLRENGVM